MQLSRKCVFVFLGDRPTHAPNLKVHNVVISNTFPRTKSQEATDGAFLCGVSVAYFVKARK